MKLNLMFSVLELILVRSTGIVDYKLITKKMSEQFESLGGEFLLNSEVSHLEEKKGKHSSHHLK